MTIGAGLAVVLAGVTPRAGYAQADVLRVVAAPAGLLAGAPDVSPATAATASVPAPAQGDVWRLRLQAFPDNVGVGGYRWPGCDGDYSAADRLVAAYQPLATPLYVVVSAPGDPRAIYWAGLMRRAGADGDIQTTVTLSQPPPYEVRLVTTDPRGYSLCPNAAATRLITQAGIDRTTHLSSGTGRDIAHAWFFWGEGGSHR